MKVFISLWIPDDLLLWNVSFLGSFTSQEKAEDACLKNLKNHGFEESGVEPRRKLHQYRIIESEVDVEDGAKNDYESNWSRLK